MKYSAYLVPLDELPPAHGIELPTGQHFVIQSHYVNTSDKPILVRDVLRLKTTDHASVETWVSSFAANDLAVQIPPMSPAESSFDCVVEEDLGLLFIAGHMHEHGKSFQFLAGPDEASLETIYDVPEWKSDYRDAPPVELMLDDPWSLPSGSVVRTVCKWESNASEELIFPQEMCTAFGYVAGTKTLQECRVGEE